MNIKCLLILNFLIGIIIVNSLSIIYFITSHILITTFSNDEYIEIELNMRSGFLIVVPKSWMHFSFSWPLMLQMTQALKSWMLQMWDSRPCPMINGSSPWLILHNEGRNVLTVDNYLGKPYYLNFWKYTFLDFFRAQSILKF